MQLPGRQNLHKAITRERLKNMSSCPQNIEDPREDFTEIRDIYKKTLAGDHFFLYDSINDDDIGKIIIYGTNESFFDQTCGF